MSTILEFIHKALVSGALAKGWGGPVCRAAVPISTHIVESLGWVVVSVIVTKGLKLDQEHSSLIKKIRSLLPISFNSSNDSLISTERKFELVMSSIHFLMFLQLVYYKSTIMSLINLLQPCHVILLLQGIALYSTTELGIIMSLYLLPTMTGTLLAMILPDTTGLDQLFELESYWLQHYIIQVIPLYLLCRKNFLALKVFSFKHIVSGLVIMALLHFVLYEVSSNSNDCLYHHSEIVIKVSVLTELIIFITIIKITVIE